MLKVVHSSIKFAQLKDDFVYDFITLMKIYEVYNTNSNHNLKKGSIVHLEIIKATFYWPKKGRLDEMWVLGLFSIVVLNLQRSMFVFNMMNNVKLAMQKPFDVNPVTKLWKTLISFWILKNKILEYIKLVELAIVKVIGFIEDEHYFSTLTFIKTKLWNRLTMHFGACHLHVQTKVLHFVELSFSSSYSKLERQHSLVWCKKLRLKLLLTCKLFNLKKKSF